MRMVYTVQNLVPQYPVICCMMILCNIVWAWHGRRHTRICSRSMNSRRNTVAIARGLVSEMTYYVSSGTLNPTHSLNSQGYTCRQELMDVCFYFASLPSPLLLFSCLPLSFPFSSSTPFLPFLSPPLRSRAILNQLKGLGEHCKLLQWGRRKRIWCTLELSEREYSEVQVLQ